MRRIEATAAAVLLFLIPVLRPRAAGYSPVSDESLPKGKQDFVSACSMCHGIDGRGGEHAPNIATDRAVQQLSASELERLIENGIPQGGMPSFRALGPQRIQALIDYLRILQGTRAVAAPAGSPDRGRSLFFGSAGCSACHMMYGKGGFLGPDLSRYALFHSGAQIRSAIVDPATRAGGPAESVVAVTRDGQTFAGIARNEDNFSLQLQTADGRFHLLMKSSLRFLRHERRSLMPADYGSRLTKPDLDDLVRFLESGAGAAGSHVEEPGKAQFPSRRSRP